MLPAPLPDLDGLDPETLKALLIAKHNESIEQHRQLRSNSEEIEHLKLVIEKYRRMIFGRKSEKLARELEQLELRLEELETTLAADQAAEAAAEAHQPGAPQSESKPRTSRPRRKPLPEDLPREVILHMPEHDACPCCGRELRQFGEDVSEQLERIPATYKVIRHVRPKFACSACDRVVEAPAPSRPIAYGLAGPDLLAHVLVSKFADHQPLYRQSEIFAREGIDLDRSTLAGWVGAASDLVAPLVDEIRKHVLAGSKIHGDDTPVPVLAPGNGRTKTAVSGPMFAMIGPQHRSLPLPSGSLIPQTAKANIRGSISRTTPELCRRTPIRVCITCMEMDAFMRYRVGLTRDASSTISMSRINRRSLQRPSTGSERYTPSRIRFEASHPTSDARFAKTRPGRSSTISAAGWRRCGNRCPARATPRARSGMHSPTGVLLHATSMMVCWRSTTARQRGRSAPSRSDERITCFSAPTRVALTAHHAISL
jgi:transposase